MPIPESQLEIFAKQGATVTAKLTADSVKNALNNYNGFPTNDYEVYLQGSYRNDTNIRGESDVDVVIQLNKTFYNNLNVEEKKLLRLEPAEYLYDNYYADVLKALEKYYGSQNVNASNKCIKIKANGNRLPIDVIVANEYRSYYLVKAETYIRGVHFFTKNGNREIINYPKQVYDNGVKKNSETNGMFKPIVRIFKNMRVNAEVEAPSYFIQCLLYNVPNVYFKANYSDSVFAILEYLSTIDDASFAIFKCQHEMFYLFGLSDEQWNDISGRIFINDMIKFWNEWK